MQPSGLSSKHSPQADEAPPSNSTRAHASIKDSNTLLGRQIQDIQSALDDPSPRPRSLTQKRAVHNPSALSTHTASTKVPSNTEDPHLHAATRREQHYQEEYRSHVGGKDVRDVSDERDSGEAALLGEDAHEENPSTRNSEWQDSYDDLPITESAQWHYPAQATSTFTFDQTTDVEPTAQELAAQYIRTGEAWINLGYTIQERLEEGQDQGYKEGAGLGEFEGEYELQYEGEDEYEENFEGEEVNEEDDHSGENHEFRNGGVYQGEGNEFEEEQIETEKEEIVEEDEEAERERHAKEKKDEEEAKAALIQSEMTHDEYGMPHDSAADATAFLDAGYVDPRKYNHNTTITIVKASPTVAPASLQLNDGNSVGPKLPNTADTKASAVVISSASTSMIAQTPSTSRNSTSSGQLVNSDLRMKQIQQLGGPTAIAGFMGDGWALDSPLPKSLKRSASNTAGAEAKKHKPSKLPDSEDF